MTIFLLVVLTLMVLVTMICSIITTIIEVKDKKQGHLVKKVLSITGIVLVITIVVVAAVGVSYFKKDNVKENNTITLENAGFNSVTLDEYLNLLKGSEKSVILVARPTCSFCEMFTPVLKQASEELGVKINYINIDEFTDDDWTKFNSSLEYLNTEEWGTPLTLIVQNNEAVDINSGYVELSEIKKFFTDNGLGE